MAKFGGERKNDRHLYRAATSEGRTMRIPSLTPLQLAKRRARQIREMGRALDRWCAYCNAQPNELCRYADGREINQVDGIHAARLSPRHARYRRFGGQYWSKQDDNST